jgi:hypothetical protein
VRPDKGEKSDAYIAAYAAAQQLAQRLAETQAEGKRQTDLLVAQGQALYQIKELARAGFLLLSEATDEKFEHLWRTAFMLAEQEKQGGKKGGRK